MGLKYDDSHQLIVCLGRYLHNHPVSSFPDIRQVCVSGAHFEDLATHYFRVGVGASGCCCFCHRDAHQLTTQQTVYCNFTTEPPIQHKIPQDTLDDRVPWWQFIILKYLAINQNKLHRSDLHYPLGTNSPLVTRLSFCLPDRPTDSRADAVPLQKWASRTIYYLSLSHMEFGYIFVYRSNTRKKIDRRNNVIAVTG